MMNIKSIINRLNRGEFDMNYVTSEYCDGAERYCLQYEISGGKIFKRKVTSLGTVSEECFENESGIAVFVSSHPYFFPYDDDFK